MANFLPAFLALIQYAVGFHLFKRPDLDGCGPLISCLLVMFAFFLILWTVDIYPRQLRKIWKCGQFLIEYLICTFLMETVMGSFWFPLERLIFFGIPKIGSSTEESVISYGWSCDILCEFLKWNITAVICIYLLSIVIFIAALHATRCINLALLEQGFAVFFRDIVQRVKKRFRNYIKIYTPHKKNVTRKASRNALKGPCDYESSDIDDSYLGLDPFAYQIHPRPR